tara:strand:- start:1313 stop:2056 length:744 start_codon:yes stop_codon:yes gene_type:complete
MLDKTIHIASDIHLGIVPRDTEDSFLRWLEYSGAVASDLILNGDLFDFWFEFRSGIPKGHERVLEALRNLIDSGIPVTLMGGNHDWWGGPFLTEEIGVTFLRNPVIMDLAGFRTFIAHGDGLGRGNFGYRILRMMLRNRMIIRSFQWLDPDLGTALGNRISMTKHRLNSPEPSDGEHIRSRVLQEWGQQKLKDNQELNLVVLGHTHVPIIEEIGSERYYVNVGDWVNHRSYLVLQKDEKPTLKEWKG